MSLVKLFSCAAALIVAAGCHSDERLDTGNTGASQQTGAPTGAAAQQIDTESNRVAPEGSRGNEPMGQPGAHNTIGQGPSGTIGPQTTDTTTNAETVDANASVPATRSGTVDKSRAAKNKELRRLQQQALQERGQAKDRTTMR